MAFLDDVKKDVRIAHNSLDDAIEADIEAAKSLIDNTGVIADESDPLIARCIKHYVRWIMDYNNQGDVYKQAFEELLATLSMSQEHKYEE